MKIANLSFLAIAGVSAGLIVMAAPSLAQAQSCYAAHSAGFARLHSIEYKATTQGVADLEVRNIFGPRVDLCEEGAYRAFMESFYSFAHDAMRPPNKLSRDKLLRLAIAVLQHAPTKVPAKEVKAAASQFRQVRSDLNSTADDVGFATTPLLQQLMDALGSLGAPMAATESVTVPPDTTMQPTTTTVTGTGTSGGVQSIRVPAEPLPGWAVVKLYEMRDHIKAQDLAAIQIKLQDIINWIEAKTRDNPQ